MDINLSETIDFNIMDLNAKLSKYGVFEYSVKEKKGVKILRIKHLRKTTNCMSSEVLREVLNYTNKPFYLTASIEYQIASIEYQIVINIIV